MTKGRKLFYIILSSLFLYLSFPNFFVKNGIFPLIFVAYIPFFETVKNSTVKKVFFWGALFGITAFGLIGIWLYRYSIFCYIMVILFYGLLLGLLALVLKLIFNIFDTSAWFMLPFAMTTFDFLRSLGPFGFTYGASGYALAFIPKLIRISSVTGALGVSFYVYLVQACIFGWMTYIKKNQEIKKYETTESLGRGYSSLAFHKEIFDKRKGLKLHRLIVISTFVFIYTILCLLIPLRHYKSTETKKILLVQSNQDPWASGIDAYSNDIKDLIALSKEALEKEDCDLVVWPETSVVPSIQKNYDGSDSRRRLMIRNLLDYIESSKTSFLIGNACTFGDKDFNSVLLFNPGKNVIPPEPVVYSKMHLVPFSETIPFEKVFGKLIEKAGLESELWEKGTDYTLFPLENSDFKFSSPVCFEDTFSSPSREFVKNGADLFITLSNDSWAESVAAQNQHLQLAVMRSAENRVPTLRCSVSGQTCYINENGRIVSMCEPFVKTYLCCNVELDILGKASTVFTRYGDVFAYIVLSLFIVLLIIQINIVIIKKIRDK